MVPKAGFLVTEKPDELLDDYHKTKLPGIIGWKLVKLHYKVFRANTAPKSLGKTAEQVLVPCYFHSLLFFIITK